MRPPVNFRLPAPFFSDRSIEEGGAGKTTSHELSRDGAQHLMFRTAETNETAGHWVDALYSWWDQSKIERKIANRSVARR